jgi:hypothetical protein
VTSDRQRAANRANSAKSTGPRTKAGKSAARLNARLHGLATAVQSEPGADAETEGLARAITDEAGRPDLIEFARRIAEAEVDLRRIRRARQILAKLPPLIVTPFRSVKSPNWNLFTRALQYESQRKQSSDKNGPLRIPFLDLANRLERMGWDPEAPDLVREPLKPRVIRKNYRLEALERYERRAFSRRKSAIRRFDALSRSATAQGASGGA